MASLNLRNIDDAVYERLRARAAEHGVSVEEKVRRIIRRSVAAPERPGTLALECFGAAHGVELELSEHGPHEPVDLGE